MLNPEIMNDLENIREQEQQIDRTKMLYKGYKSTNDFAKFKYIQSFGDTIRNGIITMDMANDEEEQLAKKIREYASNTKLKHVNKKKNRAFKIRHWHFSKEKKPLYILLDVGYFQCLAFSINQKSQKN